jgi:hypothetical protein
MAKTSNSIGNAKSGTNKMSDKMNKKTMGFSSGKGSKMANAGSKTRFGTNIQGPAAGKTTTVGKTGSC